jgi:ATP-dependent exoDNAse (exonuclease V) alpha subunit
MYTAPHQSLEETENSTDAINDYFSDRFEFGYAITCYLSQGSQFGKVLYLNENIMKTKEDQKKLAYTAITRAIDSVIVVI